MDNCLYCCIRSYYSTIDRRDNSLTRGKTLFLHGSTAASDAIIKYGIEFARTSDSYKEYNIMLAANKRCKLLGVCVCNRCMCVTCVGVYDMCKCV